MPKYAVPEYVAGRQNIIKQTPPGHRFLLYFMGWNIGDNKLDVLKNDVCPSGSWEREIIKNIGVRQMKSADETGALRIIGRLTSPLATGMGNPHPVENGFSFLSPYGIPYLPGSSVKGVIRRAAEELALFADESNWTIPMVWVLFGFEAGSAYLTGNNDNHAEGWMAAFTKWAEEKADNDRLLRNWLDIICPDKNRSPQEPERKPSEILLAWRGDQGKNASKDIHWQGLLRFWDAFPSSKVELGVEIMNPHHMKYLQGEGTPHDSEQPTPIFFLVLEPGAEFRFHVEAVDRRGLLEMVGDWQALLEEAFTYAFDMLGFGAKTAVGHGAMEHDTAAEERIEAERRAEHERREEDERQRREEEEKRQKEEALASLPEAERLVMIVENAPPTQEGEAVVNTECYPKLDTLDGEQQKHLASALKSYYHRLDKWEGGKLSKKQLKKISKIKKILGDDG